MISAEALSCSKWLAWNWGARSPQDKVYLHGTIVDPYWHEELHSTLLLKPDGPKCCDQQKDKDGENWYTCRLLLGLQGLKRVALVQLSQRAVKTGLLFQGSIENLATVRPDVLHRVQILLHCGRTQSYMLFLLCRSDNDVILHLWWHSIVCTVISVLQSHCMSQEGLKWTHLLHWQLHLLHPSLDEGDFLLKAILPGCQ